MLEHRTSADLSKEVSRAGRFRPIGVSKASINVRLMVQEECPFAGCNRRHGWEAGRRLLLRKRGRTLAPLRELHDRSQRKPEHSSRMARLLTHH